MSIRLVCLLVLALLVGCGEREPIRLGFLGGLTGRFAEFGTPGRNGAMLAIELQNERGGIDGRRIELLIRDDQQDPEVARQAVDELLKARVKAIIGPMLSTIAVAVVPQMNDAHVVLMGVTVATTILSGRNDYFYRVTGTTDDYARNSARYHFDRFASRRAALVMDLANRDFAEAWSRDYEKTFAGLGGKMLNKVPFDSRGFRQNYPEIARKLLAGNPDVISLVCSAVDAALIAQTVRRLNGKVQLSASGFASTERLIELGGEAAEGMLVEQYTDRFSEFPAYKEFNRRYVERFGHEPGYTGTSGYDAALAILAALRQDPSARDLKATLDAMRHFPGVQGELAFNEFGDAVRPPYFYLIHNGQFSPAR